MKSTAGIWIDHRNSIIVLHTDKGHEVVLTNSGVDEQPRRGGDSPLQGNYEAQLVQADDSLQRSRTQEFKRYYEAVIASVGRAESIYICGPGEAKNELKKLLEAKRLGDRITAVETAGKLTQPQVVAQVRKHFSPS